MGVDGAIFAKKAVRYFEYGRLHVLDIPYPMPSETFPWSPEQAIAACDRSLEEDPKLAELVNDVFKFLNAFPADEYFVVPDTTDDWDSFRQKYKKWEPQ